MKPKIFFLIALAAVSGVGMSAAEAHGTVVNRYDPPSHYSPYTWRAESMPFWLKKDKGFSRWYRHSGLSRVRGLQWWQVYEIYAYERHYKSRYTRNFDRDYFDGSPFRSSGKSRDTERRKKRDRK